MLLVGRAYGQEKVNARLLTSLGAALHAQTASELLQIVRYISQPGGSVLTAMQATEDYLRRPEAAIEIALSSLGAALTPKAPAYQLRHAQRPFMSFYWGKQPAHNR